MWSRGNWYFDLYCSAEIITLVKVQIKCKISLLFCKCLIYLRLYLLILLLLSCGSRVRTAPESPDSERPSASAGGRSVLSRKRWPSSPPLVGTFLKCVYLRTVASCPVRLVSVWPSACLGGPPFTGNDRPGRGIRGFACPMCRLPFLRPNRSINPADYSRFKIKNATFVAIGK